MHRVIRALEALDRVLDGLWTVVMIAALAWICLVLIWITR